MGLSAAFGTTRPHQVPAKVPKPPEEKKVPKAPEAPEVPEVPEAHGNCQATRA